MRVPLSAERAQPSEEDPMEHSQQPNDAADELGIAEAAVLVGPPKDPRRRWYAVQTYSGRENTVKTNLERRIASMNAGDKIFEVVIPMEEEIQVKDGKRQTVKKKIYPGYVFVDMALNDDSWHIVRHTPNVTGFVGAGDRPVALSDDEAKAILRRPGEDGPKVRIKYNKGDAVRIVSGPFQELVGIVDEIQPEKEKVRVLVSIFGRHTPVEIDFTQVQRA
jgi:transcriptional antiterminator NusG